MKDNESADDIFRDSKWSPIELTLSPTTIRQIII